MRAATAQLDPASRYVSEKTNLVPDRRQPYVGDAAFSHKAGQHADVILKDSVLMEHVDSACIGNQRHLVISELAGRASVLPLLRDLSQAEASRGQVEKDAPEVRALIQKSQGPRGRGLSLRSGWGFSGTGSSQGFGNLSAIV